MEGYAITLDFSVRAILMSSLATLDAVTAEQKGRIYLDLANDARTSRQLFEQVYPKIEAFRQLRIIIDSRYKFRSVLSKRLGL